MNQRIINERQEYTSEQIINQRLVPLFRKFEQGFRQYTAEILGFENRYQTANFNRYIGCLERACHAAETLSLQYDVGIGIAKKGIWLSYIFSLYGLSTHDILVFRTGDTTRFTMPLTPLYKKDVFGKRVIIFDNDLVTGKTIERVAQGMLDEGAQQTDLLLVYGNTRISPTYFGQIKHNFRNKPKVVGRTITEDIVINTKAEVPDSITCLFTLEKDFNPSRKHLTKLAKMLEVELYEKA